ncbi:clotting factor C-like isoform X2 [Centruroides vittatus]|uniref:clotting factor C-like isoform X2 n=1 Tax=Centruroides vittatus TaxID=120091 RepID=UPI00350F93B6
MRPVVLFVISSVFSIYDGTLGFINIDLNLNKACGYNHFKCECGKSREIVKIPVKLCRAHTLALRCRPCDDKLQAHKTCQNFINCQSCDVTQLTCTSCPQNRYGLWCENDCQCQNAVECHQETGQCRCIEGFQGDYCEIKTGCDVPIVRAPLIITTYPPNAPIYINYTCANGYSLLGSSHNICKNGKWHKSPPKCVKMCSYPLIPEYGEIETKKSLTYAAGETITYTCKNHYQLLGEKKNVCNIDGKWKNNPPTCVKLKLCDDPGTPDNAVRNINGLINPSEGVYPEGTIIKYECEKSFIVDGKQSIVCKPDQTWSDHIPKCVKIAEIGITCDTRGSNLMSDVGIHVRIHCPPGCINTKGDVWGTIIYREDSSVCAAAIHSGRIKSNGGSIYVVNYGMYNDFIGSELNNVLSHSYLPKARSFQLKSISSVKVDFRDRIIGCPPSWDQFEEYCIFINNDKRSWNEAKHMCQNMAGQLITLKNDIEEKLKSYLQEKKLKNAWIGLRRYAGKFKWENQDNLIENGKWSNGEPNEKNDCVSVSGRSFKWKTSNCNLQLPSICLINLFGKRKVKCKLPSPINNGKIDYQSATDNEVPEGFILTFSCDRLYHLIGNNTIRCLESGNWNSLPPKCIKVTACEEPPKPAHGIKEISYSQSVAISRIAVINSDLATDLPPTHLPEPKNSNTEDALPAGFYKVGTRVKYSCESRYYQLVGSQSRRCTKDGTWTGRIASCIPVCGRSDSKRAPFILNGNATEIGQWPWQAAVAREVPDSNKWFLLCGGALLSEQWVTTAAHCVTKGATNRIIEPDKFKIYLGKYYRDDKLDDDLVQERKVQEIHIHPDYDPHLFDADIALIHLDEPVTLTTRVQTVCLPTGTTTREHLVDGKLGIITGWGLNENQSYSQQLQQAVLPVVSYERCEKAYEDADLPLTVTENMFCAGASKINSDSCSGDSGGPMVFADDSGRERKWVLEGIVSWGSPSGCGTAGQYGGFTKVFNFINWIHHFL